MEADAVEIAHKKTDTRDQKKHQPTLVFIR